MERSFFRESRALYQCRDALLSAYMDVVNATPRGITVVDDEAVFDPLPPMPENIRIALDEVNDQIARLMAVHHELAERRHAERQREMPAY